MTRNDVLALFPDATDEQITKMLNSYNKDIVAEREKASKLKESSKTDADTIEELKKQIKAFEDEKLSDVEKANNQVEEANNKIADLEKQIVKMNQKNKLAELGITGDNADNLIGEDGSLDFDLLGTIITEREKQASALKEKELLENTPNPKGGQGANGEDDKPADVKNAESITFGNKAPDDANKNYYVI